MTHKDQIRYDILAQEALRGVMRKVLAEVAKTGLPGNHHFFITFLTHAPGVRVSSRLRENYPEQMTIVLQYQYWDLTVSETGFEVGLSFSDVPEKLIVPFSAVRGFYDPSVNFELEFDVKSEESEAEDTDNAVTQLPAAEPKSDKSDKAGTKPAAKPRRAAAKKTVKEEVAAAEPADGEPAKEEAGDSSAEVVSLDSFRKKK